MQVVHDPAVASYSLFGRLGNHQLPAYGWKRTQLAARDSLDPLPLVTTCYELAPRTSKCVRGQLNGDREETGQIDRLAKSQPPG